MKPLLYLASQSPRRQQLLAQLGVKFKLLLPRDDEDAEALEAEHAGESPLNYVERVTLAKLRAAQLRLTQSGLERAPILSADTTVVLDHRILGKPSDAAQATTTLQALSGRSHQVVTAVAVAGLDSVHHLALCTSQVRFAALPEAVINAYVASGEPFGKAGAYAIQSSLAGWIEHIEGSYSGIMGLPLFETCVLLRKLGWVD
jgi:septum formation protein